MGWNSEYVEVTDADTKELAIAVLDRIENELSRINENINQTKYESPFRNTGTTYSNDYFTVTAFNNNLSIEELENTYNFVSENIMFRWYKHSHRDLQIFFKNTITDYCKELGKCLSKCLYNLYLDLETE